MYIIVIYLIYQIIIIHIIYYILYIIIYNICVRIHISSVFADLTDVSKNWWKIRRKERDGTSHRRNDNTKRSIVQEWKLGTDACRCFESQRCLLRSQYVLLRLQRNRGKKAARCSRGCLRDWSGLIGWTLTGVEAGPTPLSPIQLLVIFAANPSVLWDLRIYPAAVKIGPPASASVERKVRRPS